MKVIATYGDVQVVWHDNAFGVVNVRTQQVMAWYDVLEEANAIAEEVNEYRFEW